MILKSELDNAIQEVLENELGESQKNIADLKEALLDRLTTDFDIVDDTDGAPEESPDEAD